MKTVLNRDCRYLESHTTRGSSNLDTFARVDARYPIHNGRQDASDPSSALANAERFAKRTEETEENSLKM